MLDIIFCNTAIEIPKKVNTKINTRITSNRGHRNRYEDAVVPPYGRMRGRATEALPPPHIHLLQACDPARMQEGYKAKDKKESSIHREHPLQGNFITPAFPPVREQGHKGKWRQMRRIE